MCLQTNTIEKSMRQKKESKNFLNKSWKTFLKESLEKCVDSGKLYKEIQGETSKEIPLKESVETFLKNQWKIVWRDH